jgi:hypothetical protein
MGTINKLFVLLQRIETNISMIVIGMFVLTKYSSFAVL